MRKNSVVWPRDIADDPTSLVFEAIERITLKLPIIPVVSIISKFFETTGAIRTMRRIIWKPGFSVLLGNKEYLPFVWLSNSGKNAKVMERDMQVEWFSRKRQCYVRYRLVIRGITLTLVNLLVRAVPLFCAKKSTDNSILPLWMKPVWCKHCCALRK